MATTGQKFGFAWPRNPRPNGASVLFDELLLPDEAIARLPIRLPWYRSLPMSCIEGLEIAIDDETVPADHVSIEIAGTPRSLADVAQSHDAVWFVLDTAQAIIQTPAPISPGDHRVSIAVTLRIPYSDPDFRPFRFVQTARTARTVSFIGRDS